jgi:hypothetical protein
MTKTVHRGTLDSCETIWSRLRASGVSSAFITGAEVRVNIGHADLAARVIAGKPPDPEPAGQAVLIF